MIEEVSGRPIKAGESFSAAFIVGFFDSIDQLHKVYDQFKEEYGTVLCRDVRKGAEGDCSEVVGRAARWVAEALLEEFTDYEPPEKPEEEKGKKEENEKQDEKELGDKVQKAKQDPKAAN